MTMPDSRRRIPALAGFLASRWDFTRPSPVPWTPMSGSGRRAGVTEDAFASTTPRARFVQGDPGQRRKLPSTAVAVAVGVVLAVVVAAVWAARSGSGPKAESLADKQPLPENVLSAQEAQSEASNLVDGGSLGSISSPEEMEGAIRRSLPLVDAVTAGDGRPLLTLTLPAPPPAKPADEAVPCLRAARSQPGARVAVYKAQAQFQGADAVVVGFVSGQRRPVNVFVMVPDGCRLLTRMVLL